MRTRLAAAVVPVLLVALAAPGLGAAKPKPQVVDPKGDSAGGQAMLDLLSVEYSTTGTGSGRGYVPKKLIVTMTLAGPPSATGLVSYNLVADAAGCGNIDIRYHPGTAVGTLIGDTYATFGSCAEYMYFTPKVKGATVSFEFSLKSIGVDRGTVFSEFTASVDPTDPVLGSVSTDGGNADGLGDKATGDGTWVVP